MPHIFQTTDKSGRSIHLSKEGWTHINEEHPEVSDYLEEIQETLKNPAKNLLVIVKYLNGEGFIITAYFVRGIK